MFLHSQEGNTYNMIETFTDAILSDIGSPITLLFILVVTVYFAAQFVIKNWGNIKSYFENAYQNRKRKEELYDSVDSLEKAKEDIIKETQELRDRLEEKTNEAVSRSEEANTRSKETLEEIKELRLILENIKTRQEEIDADRKAQKVNELRKDLIDAYHHFARIEENPKQTWNEMEAHAFWSMFSDYERYGGNDFAHKVIQPAMSKLKVIPITEEE